MYVGNGAVVDKYCFRVPQYKITKHSGLNKLAMYGGKTLPTIHNILIDVLNQQSDVFCKVRSTVDLGITHEWTIKK